eukprot:10657744-Alexandrium_andersonii.AAC.1
MRGGPLIGVPSARPTQHCPREVALGCFKLLAAAYTTDGQQSRPPPRPLDALPEMRIDTKSHDQSRPLGGR